MNENLEFYNFYKNQHRNRWEHLYLSLMQDGLKTPIKSPFLETEDYFIDPASLKVIDALPLFENAKLLDLCSAPGGKALYSFFKLKGKGQWHLNDISKERFKRLTRNFRDRVPQEMLKEKVQFFCKDASRWGLIYKNSYDFVILDAPCSSEAHILKSQKAMQQWSVKRSKGLAQRQYSLLCSALMSVKKNGYVVYSTCSVSLLENDAIIEKLLKKNKITVSIENNCDFPYEKTKYGWQIWPDKFPNQGPIYFCLLKLI